MRFEEARRGETRNHDNTFEVLTWVASCVSSPQLSPSVPWSDSLLPPGCRRRWLRRRSAGCLEYRRSKFKTARNGIILWVSITRKAFQSHTQTRTLRGKDTVSADEKDDEVDANEDPRHDWTTVCHDAIIHHRVPVFTCQDLEESRDDVLRYNTLFW